MTDEKDTGNEGTNETPSQEELFERIRKQDPNFKATHTGNVYNIKEHDLTQYPLMSFENIIDTIPAPTEFIINPIMPSPSIIFVYAATGVGKTLFTLNLAYAIAGGGNFLKYTCPKPRRVLYVDGEMPYNQIYARLMLIQKQQGDLHYKDNFLLLTPDNCHVGMPQLDSENGQKIYVDLVEKHKIEAIVFDNISTLTNIDENKSHEWKPIQDYQVKLRSKGISIINVHHAGKAKEGYRGTSRMLDVADLAISLQSQTEDQVEDNSFAKKFKIVYHKPRHLTGKDNFPFEVILDNGIWSHQSIQVSIEDKIVDCVLAGMSQREISKDLLISQPTVNRMIKKLRFSGRLPKQSSGTT